MARGYVLWFIKIIKHTFLQGRRRDGEWMGRRRGGTRRERERQTDRQTDRQTEKILLYYTRIKV